jgi:hypothetical protein
MRQGDDTPERPRVHEREVGLKKRICVIGTGYAGLANSACLADLGNGVIGVDRDPDKIEKLNQGVLPIYEPGLAEMVKRNLEAGRLIFTTSYDDGLQDAEFVFVCVGTPPGVEGEADLGDVEQAATAIAARIHQPVIVVNRSTVPIGTGDWMFEVISSHLSRRNASFKVVIGGVRLDAPGPHRAGRDRRPGGRERGPALPFPRRRAYRHRPTNGRDDQVRDQRFPGLQDLVHQRDGQHL